MLDGQGSTREITYIEALREALREEMRRDKTVFLMGEDIALGWVFGVTRGLVDEFGLDRVIDTPISEESIVGAAIGAAISGSRPVAEIMFLDFIALAMDQITNNAAKFRYQSGGQVSVPLVIRAAGGVGAAFRGGPCHSQSLSSWFMHIPGIKLVLPSTPYDAKGLLKTAIRDDNPVIFIEHKALSSVKGPVPEGEYTVPFGQADVKREGKDITIIATSNMVQKSLRAAEMLHQEGISASVVDPRTLLPLDKDGLVAEVKKTGRVVVVDEDCKTAGVGAEIAAILMEEAFDYLDAPIKRVAAKDAPIGASPILEDYVIPGEKDIVEAVRSMG